MKKIRSIAFCTLAIILLGITVLKAGGGFSYEFTNVWNSSCGCWETVVHCPDLGDDCGDFSFVFE